MCSETERDICPNDLLCCFCLSLQICSSPRLHAKVAASPGSGFLRPIRYLRHVLSFLCTYSCSSQSGSVFSPDRLVPVWMHAVISMVLAIQWTSRALSALNTCNYSHYPQSPLALPFLPLPLSVFLLTFSSGSHSGRGKRLTSTKERAAVKDRDVWSMIKKDVRKKLGNKAWGKIMRQTCGTCGKARLNPYIKNMLYVVF